VRLGDFSTIARQGHFRSLVDAAERLEDAFLLARRNATTMIGDLVAPFVFARDDAQLDGRTVVAVNGRVANELMRAWSILCESTRTISCLGAGWISSRLSAIGAVLDARTR